ncbi:cobalt-zinc-cadmium resistance protein CzcA [Catalinimonas alkaloidigena]|uniref:Cobalt-zinc-cadmium resistance protein CzcA n=1 Tax=Catalinimonas alkaloidigena TaxID=1075417 RepID=A0A1G9DBG1_9BACT|nr:CusA/CzcA family heavy metal efflux RND transporter [Catalinimonas alkaloidigena]SDK61231.1 cobalt-zinc-cadmium resistance protein CzcA [Catalinimonas alkaloidigena]
MIDSIIHFSVRNKLIIGLMALGLVAWGVYSYRQLPIDAVPDITSNQVQVVTISPSLAPQEVEKFITYPVELAVANTQDVVEIRSISSYGLSVVTIVFEEGVSTLAARQLISEHLTTAAEQIPPALGRPELMPITTGLGEIYQYTLDVQPGYEDRFTAMDLRTIQDWIVKRQLAGTPGIVEVSSFGGFLRQYEIAIDPRRLRSYDLTLDDVHEALAMNNQNTGGSYFEEGPNAYYVRAEGLVRSPSEIGAIVVKTLNNVPVLIRDIGEVTNGFAPRFGAMTKDGEGEVVGGITLMLKGYNAVNAVENVEARIAQIQTSLPEGLELNAYLDRGRLVERVIHTVQKNLIEGGLIVIFVLVLLLGNLRAGLIVASVIPLAMMFALGMMNLFGVSANLMSLGAIDFGLIVDGAVIIVESIVHRLHDKFGQTPTRLTQTQLDDEVAESAVRIRQSAAFGEIIILIVYLPIMTLVGIEGKMFRPMALTVSFAILGALILSLTYVPMMSALFLSKKVETKVTWADRLIMAVQRRYLPVLNFALRHRLIVIITAVTAFVLSLLLFFRLGAVFIPTLEEGDFAMQMTIPPGSSLEESIRTTTKAEKILRDNFPEVEHVVSKIGTAEVPTDPMAMTDTDVMIILKEKDEWTTTDDREALVGMMKEKLSSISWANFEFTQPIQLRFNELITGSKSDIALKIYGDDLNLLFEKGQQAAAIISKIPGAADIRVQQLEGSPQIVIDYNREAMSRYGLNIEQLNTAIRTALAGQSAGLVYEEERRFDLVVRLNETFRRNPESLQLLFVRAPSGTLVPLSDVATIRLDEGPMQVSRENTHRLINVGINVRNRDVKSLVEEIQQKLTAQLPLPPGYYIRYGGQFENLQAAQDRLMIAVPISLLLIFLLLFFTFHSFTQALLIFTAIPLSAIGGILALWLRDMPFSISAGVGFIALFGVAVLNGIVLVGYLNQLKQEGVGDIRERVRQGALVRLRPVLMTAAVASLGFLPMALSTTAGGEVQRPLATVVIGGLVTATLLTLLVLPVLYSWVEEGGLSQAFRRKKGLAVFVVLFFCPALLQAQTNEATPDTLEVSLDEALRLARARNPDLQNAQLRIEAAQALQRTAFDLGTTSATWQRGQINSSLTDNYWQVHQNFGAPLEHLARGQLQRQEVQVQEATQVVQERNLIGEVYSTYYRWVMLEQKRRILQRYAARYDTVVAVADLRYQTGESPYLEKLATQTRQAELVTQLRQLQTEQAVARRQLQQLLFTQQPLRLSAQVPMRVPLAQGQRPQLVRANDSTRALAAPLVRQYAAEAARAQAELKVTRAGLSPSFTAGYFNQELEGVPGFRGWQLGISFPLWFVPQQARMQAARISRDVADNQYIYAQFRLNQETQMLAEQIAQVEEKLRYFEENALPQAQTLTETSTLLYQNGEIAYYEHLLNLQEALNIQTTYQDQLYQYNQLIIRLNTLFAS